MCTPGFADDISFMGITCRVKCSLCRFEIEDGESAVFYRDMMRCKLGFTNYRPSDMRDPLQEWEYRTAHITYQSNGSWRHSGLNWILVAKCGCVSSQLHNYKKFFKQFPEYYSQVYNRKAEDMHLPALGDRLLPLFHSECFRLATDVYKGEPYLGRFPGWNGDRTVADWHCNIRQDLQALNQNARYLSAYMQNGHSATDPSLAFMAPKPMVKRGCLDNR
ncbi:hypothetical protein QBC35DRAFT_130326 [Podospora australis]|uniref:Uncharacterized protein n=1 Tax=Podospora australis TaxID=1536484 RepID=A0AAN7AE08_9PEZI|nr:hypothetical protein QBC35DRAFT_130326 [Podospora australis]